MILQDLQNDIERHGFYRTAYPTRYFAAKPFLKAVIDRAAEARLFTVISESDTHYYATVYDPARVPRSASVLQSV